MLMPDPDAVLNGSSLAPLIPSFLPNDDRVNEVSDRKFAHVKTRRCVRPIDVDHGRLDLRHASRIRHAALPCPVPGYQNLHGFVG